MGEQSNQSSKSETKPPALQYSYSLTKSKSKEDEVGGPTLLELQRSSAVVSRTRHDDTTSSNKHSDSQLFNDGNVEGPSKRLAWLSRYDERVVDLIYWKSTTKSLFTLLWIVTVLAVLRTHSAVYLITACLMSLMGVMMFIVGGSIVLQAATLSTAKHPFSSVLCRELTLPLSTQAAISDIILSLINGSLDFVGRIILVQSFGLTLRAMTLLWIVWAHIDDIYLLLIVIVCAVFTIPKLYQQHTDACESVIEVYEQNSVTGVITAHFQADENCSDDKLSDDKPRNGNIVSHSKDVITASITGLLIVLVVKYFMADEKGEIPNLVSYVWAIYNRYKV